MDTILIGIRFADNDFQYTFEGVMNTLLDAIKNGHTKLPLEKDKLVKIINELSFGCYLSHQNQFRYGTDEDREHTNNDIKINEDQVFVGHEVTDYVKGCNGWDNSEFIMLTYNEHYEKIDII